MASSIGNAAPAATVSYTDLNSLRNLKDAEGNLDAVARQFESLFVDQLLKSMRNATAALSPDSLFGGSELELRQEMLDHQWAIHTSESGGLGLRQLIMSQLSGQASTAEATAPIAAGSQAPLLRQASASYGPLADRPLPSVQEGFVKDLLPRLEVGLAGTPLVPETVLAQAALETGWGRHTLRLPNGQSSFNLFNIKATATQSSHASGSVTTTTDEFRGGQRAMVTADFRSYPDVDAAIADYRDLILGNARYAGAVEAAKDPVLFADALQEAGYATDPKYGIKVARVEASVMQWVRSARDQIAEAD